MTISLKESLKKNNMSIEQFGEMINDFLKNVDGMDMQLITIILSEIFENMLSALPNKEYRLAFAENISSCFKLSLKRTLDT